jgi:hypothetical protein
MTSPTGKAANRNSRAVRFTMIPPQIGDECQRSYSRRRKVQGGMMGFE